MKKALLTITIFIMAFIPLTASAETIGVGDKITQFDLTLLQEGGFPKLVFAENECTGARTEIRDALLEKENQITVNIPNFDLENMSKLYESVINTSPELYYVLGHVSIEQASNSVYNIYPQYKEEIKLMSSSNAMQKAVDDILAQVKPGMSDVEKILAVHDYIVLHYEYDYTYSIYNAEDFSSIKRESARHTHLRLSILWTN